MSGPGGAGGGGTRPVARRRWCGRLLLPALLLGCPDRDSASQADAEDRATTPAPSEPEAFRRRAHEQALAALRAEAPFALRRLDPVAAAEVEGTPLHPPRFGPSARAARREALAEVQRQAEGIRAELLSPPDAVVLRVLLRALERGEQHLRRPPWRDDPRALVHAVEPYLHALRRRIAAGECDDGCGLAELGPALREGLAELGAASEPAAAAAHEDLAALRQALPGWVEGLPATHPLVTAVPAVQATLVELEATLGRVIAALPTATEVAWDVPVAPAKDGAWKRRPARWGATRLRQVLAHEEAYGLDPRVLLERAEGTLMRLGAMIDRDARAHAEAKAKASERPPLPRPPFRPLGPAACETAWAPLQAWARAQGQVPALDCDTALHGLPRDPAPTDDALVLHLVEHGLVEPTRASVVAATGVDVALVRGRAAPLAQGLVLQIAITAGSGHRGAELLVLDRARERLCLAAAAVWIHGELGEVDALVPRLTAHGCTDVPALVAEAEARPRAALHGLGLLLLGEGPADAAALDRYWWAPMGLVRDLAIPPVPRPEPTPPVTVEAVAPADATD